MYVVLTQNQGFNNTTSLYQVTEPPNLEPRTRHVAGGAPIVQGLRTPRSSTDQKSIFVGNLPSDTEEAELLEIFSRYGEIKGCNIIRKPITGKKKENALARTFLTFFKVVKVSTSSALSSLSMLVKPITQLNLKSIFVASVSELSQKNTPLDDTLDFNHSVNLLFKNDSHELSTGVHLPTPTNLLTPCPVASIQFTPSLL